MNRYFILEKIKYRDGNLFFKNSGKEVDDEEAFDLAKWFNLISEVGLLFRRGLIDKDLTYRHFGNNVFSLYTKHRPIIDFIESRTCTNNIDYLFRSFSKISARNRRKNKSKVVK
mgnify:CR=1 FL=1